MKVAYEGMSSSYADLRNVFTKLLLSPGSKVVDIGSGYGRPGFTMGLFFPDLQFTGYEILPERTNEAIQIASNNKFKNIIFETKNLLNQPKEIPDADVYFFYEPTSAQTLKVLLSQIYKISTKNNKSKLTRFVVRGETGVIVPYFRTLNWLTESQWIYNEGTFLYNVFTVRNSDVTPSAGAPVFSEDQLKQFDDPSFYRWFNQWRSYKANNPEIHLPLSSLEYVITKIIHSPNFNRQKLLLILESGEVPSLPDHLREKIAIAALKVAYFKDVLQLITEHWSLPESVYIAAIKISSLNHDKLSELSLFPALKNAKLQEQISKLLEDAFKTLETKTDLRDSIELASSIYRLSRKWNLPSNKYEEFWVAKVDQYRSHFYSVNKFFYQMPAPLESNNRDRMWEIFRSQDINEQVRLAKSIDEVSENWNLNLEALKEELILMALEHRSERSVTWLDDIPISSNPSFRQKVVSFLYEWKKEKELENSNYGKNHLSELILNWKPK